MNVESSVGAKAWSARCRVWGPIVCVWAVAGCAGMASPPPPSQLKPAQEQYARGVRLAAQGDYVRAEQFLSVALGAGYPAAQVLPLLLRVCVRGGRVSRALFHTERALEASPEDPRLWTLSGALLSALGRSAEAVRHLEHAASLPDARPDTSYWLATALADVPDRERARILLVAYLRMEPSGTHAPRARWLLQEWRLTDVEMGSPS